MPSKRKHTKHNHGNKAPDGPDPKGELFIGDAPQISDLKDLVQKLQKNNKELTDDCARWKQEVQKKQAEVDWFLNNASKEVADLFREQHLGRKDQSCFPEPGYLDVDSKQVNELKPDDGFVMIDQFE